MPHPLRGGVLRVRARSAILEHVRAPDEVSKGDNAMKPCGSLSAVAVLGLALVSAAPAPIAAQTSEAPHEYVSTLRGEHPATYDLLIRLERVHGILFGQLAAEGETVRASADTLPSPDFEFDMLDRLGALVREEGTLDDYVSEADAGYAVLGDRAKSIIEWTNEFRGEVLGILADPSLTEFPARRAAVAAAVERYRSRPEAALPSEPKDMQVLYDHNQALDFRTGYADLDGLIWAGHWLKLAVTEPLVDYRGPERAAGLDTVQARYYSKLSYGEPPEFFPSELPLAPAIGLGLAFLSPETALIWDNLSLMQETLADVLASPDVADERAAIDAVVEFFMDPTVGMTDRLNWRAMALRHGIFYQGGYPLAVMTASELNVGGHLAHLRGGTGPAAIVPGM